MIRRYDFHDACNNVPRFMIVMEIFGDGFRLGYNQHYSLDTPLEEALADFFTQMVKENPEYKIDLKRSKLEIEFLDLPKEEIIRLTNP